MSILGGSKYIIEHKQSAKSDIYVDSFDTLRRTIATTWSKVPHIVKVEGMVVEVLREGSDKDKLATFIFTPLTSNELPDHL